MKMKTSGPKRSVQASIVIMYSLVLCLLAVVACEQKELALDGPYFGNGFRNGWADQNSIVIWTRLTKNKEMNSTGQAFIPMTSKRVRELAKEDDEDKLLRVQMPDSLSLEDMEGACPGAAGQVKLIYFKTDDPQNKLNTDWQEVDTDKNYTLQWPLHNLEAGANYELTILARKNAAGQVTDSIGGTFATPPPVDKIDNINFSITSCHDYNRRDSTAGHKIYAAMSKDDLDFYVHTGDIEYYDKKNPWALTEELMRFKWDRLFALPLQRSFYTKTTSYFMKDDHDVLKDDAYQGMTFGSVSFERGLEIFDKEQFPSAEKTYKTIRWGKDLQVWILEGRKYRSKNTDEDGPTKTILGMEQKEWLFKTVEGSDATCKVIVTASPILGPDRPKGKNDNHSNEAFRYEGEEIRNFLSQYDNVFICNGDRHWQYVTHLEDMGLWEFGCGSGADGHAGGWDPDNRQPQHRFLRVKGGYLIGKVYREEANQVNIKFEHRDVNGKVMHVEEFSVAAE